MIPYRSELGTITEARLGERTFKLDKETKTVHGEIDGIEAVQQAAYLILHTERYIFPIYGMNFGTEIDTLYGREDSFLFPELRRRVSEALMVDDRIIGTSDFLFFRRGQTVEVQFVIQTVFGEQQLQADLFTAIERWRG